MTSRDLKQTPIAIVSAGCTLPDARNVEEFWVRLMEAIPSIRKMPESRWQSEYHLTEDRSDREKTYTRHAAHLSEEAYADLHRKWHASEDPLLRLRLQTIESFDQVVKPYREKMKGKSVATFIGCMHYDDAINLANFEIETPEIVNVLRNSAHPDAEMWLRQYLNYREREMLPILRPDATFLTQMFADFEKRYDFKGSGAFVDAACASSLAAIDLGLRRLCAGECDYLVAGGVEAFLAPSAFVSFTSMGALAPEVCLPFDKRSEGASLGEGCVLFLFQRLEDARREGNHVLAVIEGMGASSDGNSSSLFSPTVNGQKRAYQECYEGVEKDRLVYLECHGTGTPLGDSVELQSCAEYFANQSLYVGSTKAIWGHTRGAAGAVGLLKALTVLNEGKIPPARHFKVRAPGMNLNLQINTETTSFDSRNALVGVSSFGFGGINYHMALSHGGAKTQTVSQNTPPGAPLIVAHSIVDFAEIEKTQDWSALKIAPRSRRQTDRTQVAGLIAAKRVIEGAGIPLKLLNKDRVAVISSGRLGTINLKRFATSCHYRELEKVFEGMPNEEFAKIRSLRERYAPITEDTGAGGLNNVIAGRICNYFDFHGKSYHIDADDLSWATALECATFELKDHADLVLVLGFEYAWDEGDWVEKVEFKNAVATLLTTEAVAKRLALRVESVLEVRHG